LFNGREFKPFQADQLVNSNASMFDRVGTPTGYWFSSVNTIDVLPIPSDTDAGRVITMRVTFTPTAKAVSLDSEVMERYMDALVYGCKAKMMMMPSKPWSNTDLASFYLSNQTIEVGKARIDQMNDMTTGSITIQKRQFGR
jgi:hypothetical protein